MKRIISNKKCIDFIFYGRSISSNKIALTFDDGPHPVNTLKLLALLEKENIKATFFCSGAECEKYPGLIKEIARQGHEIGNHSYRHKRLKEIGVEDYRGGILRTNEIIYKSTGIKPRLFRAPYGELNLRMVMIVRSNKMIYAGWTIDSNDSYIKEKRLLIQHLSKQNIRKGDILLFHEDYEQTIEAMPEIVGVLKAKGFSFGTVSGLKD